MKQLRIGRKVFKLLKFVDEYKEVNYQIRSFNFEKLKLAAWKVLFKEKQYIGKEQINAKVVFSDFLLTIKKCSAMILHPISICLIGIAQNITAMIKIWLRSTTTN